MGYPMTPAAAQSGLGTKATDTTTTVVPLAPATSPGIGTDDDSGGEF